MGKRMKRAKQNSHNSNNNDVIQLDVYRSRKSKVIIIPRNIHQEEYIEMLDNSKKNIVFAIGPAGTGKTLLAVQSAIVNLKKGNVEKIVITRPAVSVDEQHGFLPGTLIDKMAPWTKPIFDVFEQYWAPKQIANMIEEGIIEIAPLAFMRGRTLDNAFVILDEAQNSTESQMKMFLTRMGKSAKFIITRDVTQIDLPKHQSSGLVLAQKILQRMEGIGFVILDERDIIRHTLVKKIIKAFHKPKKEK